MKIILIGLLIVFFLLLLSSVTFAFPAIPMVEDFIEGPVFDMIRLRYYEPYVIQKGDNLIRIARRHEVTLQDLLEVNPGIENPNIIEVGYTLLIPRPQRMAVAPRASTPRPFVRTETFIANISGYAPLDPNAVEGMCYSGDPTVTASGARTTPMHTIAMDRRFPFGTKVKIHHPMFEGIVFTVEDRFGKGNHGNKVDVCFATRKEAFAWGRRNVKVTVYFDG